MITQQHASPVAPSSVQEGVGGAKPGEACSSALIVRIGSRLDPGFQRRYKPNEDALFVRQGTFLSAAATPTPFALLLVADGMGGQEHGREASWLATRSLIASLSGPLRTRQTQPEDWLSLLVAGVQRANQAVYQRNQAQYTRMGTTMTAALVIDTTAYVAHVGDSRLYRFRPSKGLSQITHDHSLVALLMEMDIIQPEDIYTHPMRNQIYRFLGGSAEVEIEQATVPLAEGDTLLVCSDGLWEMVRDQHIAALLSASTSDPEATASALVQAALAGGGADNVSVIVAQVSNAEVPSASPAIP